MSRSIYYILLTLISFQLIGSDDNFIGVRPRILDGTVIPSAYFPSVAKLKIQNPNGDCTGTLISPYHVLTAGHCVLDQYGHLTVTTNSRIELGGIDYAIKYIYVHPSYTQNLFTLDGEGVYDVAILELYTSPSVSPTPICRVMPTTGTTMKLAGFGFLGSGQFGESGATPAPGYISYGFTPLDYLTPTYLSWYFSPGESSTSHGDSGGPAFILINGTDHVEGVTHGGPKYPTWGGIQYDTRVDVVASWIDSIVGFTDLDKGPIGSSIPNSVRIGELFHIQTTVSNNGLDAASFVVRFRLSPDGIYRETDPFLGDCQINQLLGGQYYTYASINSVMPNVATGYYRIAYKIDALDEVYESDKTNNTFYSTGYIYVKPDQLPQILSGPFVDPQPSFVGQQLTFEVYATDADGDSLTYRWDFGDGTIGYGSTALHTYAVEGTYDINITISDGLYSTVTDAGTLDVISELPVQMFKHKFNLNFTTKGLYKDNIDITFENYEAFGFYDKKSFMSAMSDFPSIGINIGGQPFDIGQLYPSAKGFGLNGTFSWDYRIGTVRYIAKNINLKSTLSPLGAVNANTSIYALPMPITLTLRNAKYNTLSNFVYTAKQGKSGIGR